MFFGSWAGLGCVLVMGAPGCLALMVRASGNRTLSRLKAFTEPGNALPAVGPGG